jgi:hypothetical protein
MEGGTLRLKDSIIQQPSIGWREKRYHGIRGSLVLFHIKKDLRPPFPKKDTPWLAEKR